MTKKIILIMTLLSFICMTGCKLNTVNGDSTKLDENNTETQAEGMEGRYVEEVADCPEGVGTIYGVKKGQNGSIQLLFASKDGELCLYDSTDQGSSWIKNEKVSNEPLADNRVLMSACFGNNGSLYVSVADCSIDELNQYTGEYLYFEINTENGESKKLEFDLPEPLAEISGSGYGMKELVVTENNQLCGILNSGSEQESRSLIAGIDLSSSSLMWSKEMEGLSLLAYGEDIYVKNADKIQKLDGATGEYLNDIELGLSDNSIDIDTEKERIFYCTYEGIYSTDYGVTLTQKLVDASLCSIMNGDNIFENLLMIDETTFLLFVRAATSSGDQKLAAYRYVYHEDLATEPNEQLTIYSLKENNTVRNLVTEYYKQNSNIQIQYEVGMDDDSVQSVSDAINTLNTEIIAGNGPDLIILNGLPWESYAQKGILANMDDTVHAIGNDEELFVNIFNSLQTNDIQYVVPLGVRIPVAYGVEDFLEGVDSLATLTDAADVAGQTADAVNIGRGNKDLLRFFVSIEWNKVVNSDWQISKDDLSSLLERIKKLHTLRQESAQKKEGYGDFGLEDYANSQEYSKSYDVFYEDTTVLDDVTGDMAEVIASRNVVMSTGYLSSIKEYGVALGQGYKINTISDRAFSALIIGVNASSEQKDRASDFISFALSTELQENFFDDRYLPVNSTAYNHIIKEPSQDQLEGYTIAAWPDEEFQQLEDWMRSRTTLSMEDEVVIDTLMEGGWSYLEGEKNLDTAVNEITQTLDLYFAE